MVINISLGFRKMTRKYYNFPFIYFFEYISFSHTTIFVNIKVKLNWKNTFISLLDYGPLKADVTCHVTSFYHPVSFASSTCIIQSIACKSFSDLSRHVNCGVISYLISYLILLSYRFLLSLLNMPKQWYYFNFTKTTILERLKRFFKSSLCPITYCCVETYIFPNTFLFEYYKLLVVHFLCSHKFRRILYMYNFTFSGDFYLSIITIMR